VTAEAGTFGELAEPGMLPAESRTRLVWSVWFRTRFTHSCPIGAVGCRGVVDGQAQFLLDYRTGEFIVDAYGPAR